MVVQSMSKKGIEYTVAMHRLRAVSCTCPDHCWRRHKCKHMKHAEARALAYVEAREVICAARGWETNGVDALLLDLAKREGLDSAIDAIIAAADSI